MKHRHEIDGNHSTIPFFKRLEMQAGMISNTFKSLENVAGVCWGALWCPELWIYLASGDDKTPLAKDGIPMALPRFGRKKKAPMGAPNYKIPHLMMYPGAFCTCRLSQVPSFPLAKCKFEYMFLVKEVGTTLNKCNSAIRSTCPSRSAAVDLNLECSKGIRALSVIAELDQFKNKHSANLLPSKTTRDPPQGKFWLEGVYCKWKTSPTFLQEQVTRSEVDVKLWIAQRQPWACALRPHLGACLIWLDAKIVSASLSIELFWSILGIGIP